MGCRPATIFAALRVHTGMPGTSIAWIDPKHKVHTSVTFARKLEGNGSRQSISSERKERHSRQHRRFREFHPVACCVYIICPSRKMARKPHSLSRIGARHMFRLPSQDWSCLRRGRFSLA